jgi:hypothetical protein
VHVLIVQDDAVWLEVAAVGMEFDSTVLSPWILRLQLRFDLMAALQLTFAEIKAAVRRCNRPTRCVT